MAAHVLTQDKPWPHVGRVDSQGESGTGFIVRGRYALTAAHLVGQEATKVIFVHQGRKLDAEIVARFNKDIALLRLLSDAPPSLAPLPLGRLTNLPIAYTTWGYRSGKENIALQGSGMVEAWLEDGSLQLKTQTQRLGMSGAPVAVGGRGGLRIVAIAVARYRPAVFQDNEPLAFAFALAPLPLEVREYLGDLEEREIDRTFELAAATMYERCLGKIEASRRITKMINALSVVLFFSLVVSCLNLIDPLIGLPAISVLSIVLVYLWFRSRELASEAELASTLSSLIRSADPDSPLPKGFRHLLEALK